MSKQAVKVFQVFNPKIQRGNAKTCELCSKQFSIFARQHQCKRCLRAVCDNCGTKKTQVFKQKMTKQAHRLCDVCAKQSQFLQEHIKENNLIFGVASQQGRRWSKRVQRKLSDSLQNFQISESKNSGRFTKQLFSEMWDSYNYSLREFIGLLTFNLKQQDIYERIKDVYQKLLKHYPQQKMENICYVIIFVLCYCDEQLAVEIVLFLLQLKRTIVQSKQLINLYLGKLGMNQDQIKKAGDFVKQKTRKFVSNFSINLITAQASIHLISRLIQRKKIDQLYIHFALVIEVNKEIFVKAKNKNSDCDLALIRNCNLQRISNKYRILGSVKTHNFIKNQVHNGRFQGARSQVEKSEQKQQDDFLSVKSGNKNPQDFRNYIGNQDQDQSINSGTQQIFKKNISFEPDDTQSDYGLGNKDDRSVSNYSTRTFNIQSSQQIVSPMRKRKQFSQQQYNAIKEDQYEASNKNKEINKIPTISSKKSQISQEQSPIRLFASLITQSQNQQCKQCQNHKKKIDSLQQKIRNKNLQIESLQMRTRLDIQNESSVRYDQQDFQAIQENQLQKKLVRVQQELRQSNGKLNNIKEKLQASEQQKLRLEKQIVKLESDMRRFQNQKQLASKIRQQNVALKNQVEEINLTNKMLKNKLQSASFGSTSTSSGRGTQLNDRSSSVTDAQLKKINQMLKASLMEKNDQLEAFMKQNKLLTYQIESLSNNTDTVEKLQKQKFALEKSNRQLMQKIQQLSEMLIKQQAEKLKLSDLVFQYKQSQKVSKNDGTKSATAVGSEKSSECGIF